MYSYFVNGCSNTVYIIVAVACFVCVFNYSSFMFFFRV